jgi:poly(A) polymerase
MSRSVITSGIGNHLFDGEDIMRSFAIGPGRYVGMIKNAIREAILEGEIPNAREEAFTFMIEKGISLGLTSTIKD